MLKKTILGCIFLLTINLAAFAQENKTELAKLTSEADLTQSLLVNTLHSLGQLMDIPKAKQYLVEFKEKYNFNTDELKQSILKKYPDLASQIEEKTINYLREKNNFDKPVPEFSIDLLLNTLKDEPEFRQEIWQMLNTKYPDLLSYSAEFVINRYPEMVNGIFDLFWQTVKESLTQKPTTTSNEKTK